MKSKIVFRIAVAVFLAGIAAIGYDMGRRTTFPGSKPQLQERLKRQFGASDSVSIDSGKSDSSVKNAAGH